MGDGHPGRAVRGNRRRDRRHGLAAGGRRRAVPAGHARLPAPVVRPGDAAAVDVRPDRGRDGDADGDHAGGDATGLVRRSRRLAGRRLARTLPRLQHWPGTGVAALPYAGASVRAGLIRAARVARPEPTVLAGAAEAASSSPESEEHTSELQSLM